MSFGLPAIEKDPTIEKLAKSVFEQLMEIDRKENPIETPATSNSPNGVQSFSVEDAIKELIELKKKGI
jgi:hypothetical protein